jgi:hypothetical protein
MQADERPIWSVRSPVPLDVLWCTHVDSLFEHEQPPSPPRTPTPTHAHLKHVGNKRLAVLGVLLLELDIVVLVVIVRARPGVDQRAPEKAPPYKRARGQPVTGPLNRLRQEIGSAHVLEQASARNVILLVLRSLAQVAQDGIRVLVRDEAEEEDGAAAHKLRGVK